LVIAWPAHESRINQGPLRRELHHERVEFVAEAAIHGRRAGELGGRGGPGDVDVPLGVQGHASGAFVATSSEEGGVLDGCAQSIGRYAEPGRRDGEAGADSPTGEEAGLESAAQALEVGAEVAMASGKQRVRGAIMVPPFVNLSHAPLGL